VLYGPMSASRGDPDHSADERRFVTSGVSYQRSDFPALVRGKFVARLRRSSNVVVLDPKVAGHFPNAAAVNAAPRLVDIAKRAGSPPRGAH